MPGDAVSFPGQAFGTCARIEMENLEIEPGGGKIAGVKFTLSNNSKKNGL